MRYSTILHELTHSRASGITQHALQEPEAYGWKACVNAKSPSNSESLAMFCLGTNKIELGYSILEDGSVLTASQVDGLAYGSSDSSRAGHSSGAASPGVDDPDRYVIAKCFHLLLSLRTHLQGMGWNERLFSSSGLSLHSETFIERDKLTSKHLLAQRLTADQHLRVESARLE